MKAKVFTYVLICIIFNIMSICQLTKQNQEVTTGVAFMLAGDLFLVLAAFIQAKVKYTPTKL